MSAIFKEGFSFSGYERDLLVMNLGGGEFLDISGASGVDSISDGRGAVFADFDNDGDADIFLTTVQREAHYLFRNNVGNRNRFVRVQLEGTTSGRDAFGAVVRVKTSQGVQTKLKAGGSGFVSQSDPRLLFGLGTDERAEWLEVVWPGGAVQRLTDVRAGSSIHIVEGANGHRDVAENRFRLVDPLSGEAALLAGLGFERGGRFPDLAVRSVSGETARVADLVRPGRRTLVNLWATWCGPCVKEMPQLQKIHADLQQAGVDLVGISVDLDTAKAVPGFVTSMGVAYPVYTIDPPEVEKLYPRGEATVPLTVLLDGQGRVVEVYSGWNEKSEAAVRNLMGRKVG